MLVYQRVYHWLVVLNMLKNDGVRQWEGWHPIYEMENNPVMIEPTNQIMSPTW